MDYSDPRPIVIEIGHPRRRRSRRRTLVMATVVGLALLAGLWWALGRADQADARLNVGDEQGAPAFPEHDGRARVSLLGPHRGTNDLVVLAAC